MSYSSNGNINDNTYSKILCCAATMLGKFKRVRVKWMRSFNSFRFAAFAYFWFLSFVIIIIDILTWVINVNDNE